MYGTVPIPFVSSYKRKRATFFLISLYSNTSYSSLVEIKFNFIVSISLVVLNRVQKVITYRSQPNVLSHEISMSTAKQVT